MSTITPPDVEAMMDRYGYSPEMRRIIADENLLPAGLLSRLHATYPRHSGLLETGEVLFTGREHYSGLSGFRQVVGILAEHGVHLGDLTERELFVEVYRFKASRHALNSINWGDYEHDSMFRLVFPQRGMMRRDLLERYEAAASPGDRSRIASDYVHETNPHDAHQLLNKAWMERGARQETKPRPPDRTGQRDSSSSVAHVAPLRSLPASFSRARPSHSGGKSSFPDGLLDDGDIDLVEGSQHKYPPCMLIFDQTTQECFAFCTYCFRHAQVRGDHDMFIQEDVDQVHAYLRGHTEVTDLLITGGDAGYMPLERLRRYVVPILEDSSLFHVRIVRLGSRMLTYEPERILAPEYEPMLAFFDHMRDNGLQMTWVAHFSTPRELLNPTTIGAVRRLQNHGVVVRSQSPIMNHISLFTDGEGRVDVERSAQNWIDLANVLGTLGIRFHSMYCARATGEHHYFTVPLADIDRIFELVFRSVASLNRPSRYITMTTSAGKISILGVAEVGGRKAFVLKFNEARNMEWMDRVFLAQYDETTNRIDFLKPFDTPEFFFEKELHEIEQQLMELHKRAGAGAILLPPTAEAAE
jgi:lysine 2,3-aminomutase